MHFPSPTSRSITISNKNKISVTKQKSTFTQEDVLVNGNGIVLEHDS